MGEMRSEEFWCRGTKTGALLRVRNSDSNVNCLAGVGAGGWGKPLGGAEDRGKDFDGLLS